MQAAFDWFEPSPRALPSRATSAPTSTTKTFSRPANKPNRLMTESLNVTTSAKQIDSIATEAGTYIRNQAARLVDSVVGEAISELSWTRAGVHHVLLGTQVEPYRGSYSAVRPMERFALVRAQPGNEAHVERLIAAVRSAMADRDAAAADRSIRSLGAEGFDVTVVGV